MLKFNSATPLHTNKEKKSAYILVYLNYAVIAFLVFLIYKYQFTLFSLGGSLVFIAIMNILIFLMVVIKPLAFELSISTLIITGIFVFNFLSFWEISGKNIDATYLTISFLCLYLFVHIYLFVVRLPFKNHADLSESDRIPFKQIMLTLLLPVLVIGFAFAMISGLMVYSTYEHVPNAMTLHPFVKITLVGIAWLVLSFFISFIYLSKIKDKDIKNLIINEKLNIVKFDTRKIKEYFTKIFFLTVFIGSLLEIQRGMWIMWIETILLLLFMSLIIWKIYKHIFSTDEA